MTNSFSSFDVSNACWPAVQLNSAQNWGFDVLFTSFSLVSLQVHTWSKHNDGIRKQDSVCMCVYVWLKCWSHFTTFRLQPITLSTIFRNHVENHLRMSFAWIIMIWPYLGLMWIKNSSIALQSAMKNEDLVDKLPTAAKPSPQFTNLFIACAPQRARNSELDHRRKWYCTSSPYGW